MRTYVTRTVLVECHAPYSAGNINGPGFMRVWRVVHFGATVAGWLALGGCATPTDAPFDACDNKFGEMVGEMHVVMDPPLDFGLYHDVARGDTIRFTAVVRRVDRVYDSDPDNLWRPLDFSPFGGCRVEWGATVPADITWKSSTPAVATVEVGVVVARADGFADITARASTPSVAETRRVRVSESGLP